jgi:hypothetical protein
MLGRTGEQGESGWRWRTCRVAHTGTLTEPPSSCSPGGWLGACQVLDQSCWLTSRDGSTGFLFSIAGNMLLITVILVNKIGELPRGSTLSSSTNRAVDRRLLVFRDKPATAWNAGATSWFALGLKHAYRDPVSCTPLYKRIANYGASVCLKKATLSRPGRCCSRS